MADSSKDDQITFGLLIGALALFGIGSAAIWIYHELGLQNLGVLAILVLLLNLFSDVFVWFSVQMFSNFPFNRPARQWMPLKGLITWLVIPLPNLALAFLAWAGFSVWVHWGDQSVPTLSGVMAMLVAFLIILVAVSIPVILAWLKLRQLVPRLTCPYCNNHIFVSEPWVCGYGGHFNSGKMGHLIVEKCEQCGNFPEAYECPHPGCGKPIPLDHVGAATDAEFENLKTHWARKWVSEEEKEKQEREKREREKRELEERQSRREWEIGIKQKELASKEQAQVLKEREEQLGREKKNLMDEFTAKARESFKQSASLLLTSAKLKKEFNEDVDKLEGFSKAEKDELKRNGAARLEEMQTSFGSRSGIGFRKEYH